MRVSRLLDKLWVEKREFVTSDTLKEYCKKLGTDYDTAVKNFVHRGHLTRIFRGMFYVRPPEGLVTGSGKYNHLELVARGIELKGVKNWYFGLYTGLKLNNMTHEHFVIDYVVSDSVFRHKPVKVGGCRFRFVKLAAPLFGFGTKKEGLLCYSDPEKTILDFICVWKQNGRGDERIIMDVSEWAEKSSREKMRGYFGHYPNSVVKTADRMLDEL